MFSSSRRGSAFIEVLVALVLLATVGTALVTLLGQMEYSLRQVSNSETATRAAAGELARLSLLSRAQLLGQLGMTSSTHWRIIVEETSPALFDVTVSAQERGEPLVRTTFYRPDSAYATR